MLTDSEKQAHVGKLGWLDAERGKLMVPIKVLDMREAYGNRQALIMPMGGTGSKWVDAGRIMVGDVLGLMRHDMDRELPKASEGPDQRPCPQCMGTMDGKLDGQGICEACGWRVQ